VERNFPYSEMKMLASARSAGKSVDFDGESYVIEELTEASFDGVDIEHLQEVRPPRG
jgi:aspartate-semialdehyde dehydrogenase